MPDNLHTLRVLGPPQLEGPHAANVPRGKPLAALIYLAVEDRPVRRVELADLLWTSSPKRAGQSIREVLRTLRKEVGASQLIGGDPVSLDRGGLALDLNDYFDALADSDLERALSLWRGPFLDGFHLSDVPAAWPFWVEERRASLLHDLVSRLRSRAAAERQAGDRDSANDWLTRAIALHPDCFGARTEKIELLLELRRPEAASEELGECRRRCSTGPEEAGQLARLADRMDLIRQFQSDSGAGLIGRAKELESLLRSWSAAQRGDGQAVALVGPSGIGKTRLASEMAAAAQGSGGMALSVVCYREERSQSLSLVGDLARQLKKLPGALGITAASEATLRALVPSVAGASSDGNHPGRPSDVAFADALCDLIEAVAFEAPLFVSCDDLQWSDRESLEVLGRVSRRLRRQQVLLLWIMRSEASGTLRNHLSEPDRVIRLLPLTSEEVLLLLERVASLAPDAESERVARRLYDVTGGNPLFLTELLHELGEAGALERDGEGRLTDPRAVDRAIGDSESVRNLLLRRLARLPEEVRVISAELATSPQGAPHDVLLERTGLSADEFGSGLQELIRREIAEFSVGDRIQFTHEEHRTAAAATAAKPNQQRRKRALLAAATAALALAATAIVSLNSWRQADEAGPYSGSPLADGQIALAAGSAIVTLRPPERTDGPWRLGEIETPRPAYEAGDPFRGPFRTTDGDLRFVGSLREPDGPPVAAVWEPALDRWNVVWRTDGDANSLQMSPDGGSVLVASENVATPGYDIDLIRVDIATGAGQLVHRSAGKLGSTWSPDGMRILAWVSGVPDSFLVLNPDGRVLQPIKIEGHDTFRHADWCSDSRQFVALSQTLDLHPTALLVDSYTGGFQELPIQDPISSLTCIGSAEAFAAIANEEHDAVLTLYGGDDWARIVIPRQVVPVGAHLAWLPDSLPAIASTFGIAVPEPTIDWGGRFRSRAEVTFSDGAVRPVRATWTSSDPGILSVWQDGSVFGNRPGVATLRAEYESWFTDSVLVEVQGTAPDQVLFEDHFDRALLDKWVDLGNSPPRVVDYEDESVLRLQGDGVHSDGIRSAQTFSATRGFTAEFEFLSELEADNQDLRFCIEAGTDGGSRPAEEALCVGYPWGELVKQDRLALRAVYPAVGLDQRVPLSDDFDSSRWNHLAIQVRADGEVGIILNRQPLVALGRRLDLSTELPWEIVLKGQAFDADVLVRYVTVWEGEQYGAQIDTGS